ncbi:MAG TPA: N-formylglutamate deformylase [Roseovarius sp.]|nr:N-formylglutamate deformylase [Roseovarius sp.]
MIEVMQGDGPLVLGLPHTGTYVPPEIETRLNETGRALADTDWHIERLYDGLVAGVTTVRTRAHRYVIDVNRAPDDETLYPGQNTTGLVPLTDFDGLPIWQDGKEPDAAEVEARRATYHAPYHAALMAELERVRARHGFAILYDCHSIRSRIPFLFEGTLPDLNIGTNGGTTCAPGIAEAVEAVCRAADGYTTVTDGRFKGGWTTRHYGRPGEGLHAIQMELAQSTYLAAETPPWAYDARRAERLRSTLRPIFDTLSDWRP